MTIRFQARRSYNSNDWTLKRDGSGRVTHEANNKGVKRRTAWVLAALNTGEKSISELTAHLQDLHPSYTAVDVRQPLQKLAQAGLLYVTGKGTATRYSLGANAKDRWKRITSK